MASTHAYILIFTNTGRVYWLKVYEIPESARPARASMSATWSRCNRAKAYAPSSRSAISKRKASYIFFVTRKGTVKKTPLKDFCNVMSRGIIAIGIEKDDELVAASCTDGKQIIFLASHDGMAIRFDEEDVRPMGRPAYRRSRHEPRPEGLHRRHGGDTKGASRHPPKRKKKRRGEAKLVPTSSSPSPRMATASAPRWTNIACTGRGGKGVINVKTTERNGKVVGSLQVNEKSEADADLASTARSSAWGPTRSARPGAPPRAYGC